MEMVLVAIHTSYMSHAQLQRQWFPVHATDARQPLSIRGARKNKIGILGDPKKAEINLAEQRPAFQQNPFAHALPKGPEDPRQVEILLDELRLHPVACSRLAAQIGEEGTVRKPREHNRQLSFSMTLQRRLKGPVRGAPGSIESTDFDFSTR